MSLRFAKDGAKVAVVGRTPATLQAIARKLETLGASVDTFAPNVGDYEAVRSMAKAVLGKYGRVDVL